jgi:urocanate hydratase
MKYLSEMTDEQTLVMYSGHPLGYAAAAAAARQSPMMVLTRALGWS